MNDQILNDYKKEVRSEELYSFNVWIGISFSIIFYIIYALVPKYYFDLLGLTFLPDKYWVIAVPTHFVMTLCYIFIFTIGLNKYITNNNVKKGI